MIKPDAIGRRLCGEIVRRYEAKGLKLVGLKMQILTRDTAEKHYAEHKGKPFCEALLAFITSGPTIQMVWEGENAIEVVRTINGATSCETADVGTIRGDFGLNTRNNLVHASDCAETAAREIELYFGEADLVSYTMPDAHWLA